LPRALPERARRRGDGAGGGGADARELGRDALWRQREVAAFTELAKQYVVA